MKRREAGAIEWGMEFEDSVAELRASTFRFPGGCKATQCAANATADPRFFHLRPA